MAFPQARTCQPLEFSWFYIGPDSVFTFYATNVGVLQSGAPPPLTLVAPSSTNPSNTFTDLRRAVPTAANPVPLATTVALSANVPGPLLDLTWAAVTVPQGWYVINATTQSPEYTVLSPAFYVHTGVDTSCLLAVTTSTISSPGSTSFPIPVGGSSTSSGGAGTGTIIGATIGSAAFVAALFAIWLCFLRRRRNRSQGGDFRKGLAHRWNGLSSTDAGLTGGGTLGSYQHQAHRVGSMGTIQTLPSDEAVGAEKYYSTTGKFDDDTTSNGHGGLAFLPVLTHAQPNAVALGRTYSTSSSVSAHGGPPQNEVYASTPAPFRRGSITDSVHGRQSVDSTTYPPTSPTRHSTLTRTHSNSKSAALGYPPSPTSPQGDTNNNNYTTSPIDAATKQANRHSLGRKRKPVPAYDPNQNPSTPVSPAAFQVPPVPSPSPYSSEPSPSPEPSVVSHSANDTGGAGGGHYATRSPLGQDHSVPDLTHKSSFGPGGVEGKPLHYLIPDMPMPLRH